ncbi:MAG: hypothetical protein M1818_001250 [Claussenomyces sp. TS43310]|nr:MAG: hypothetical protein M1818_001250 [Claussenomyces sp. TS43310]
MDNAKWLLHQTASAHKPNIATEPTELLVAVLSPDKTAYDCQASDFTWFKCRANHTIKTICTHYQRKTSKSVGLKHGALRLLDTDPIYQLDDFKDNVVVFVATETESHRRTNGTTQDARTPLRPINTQVAAKSSGSPNIFAKSPLVSDVERPCVHPRSNTHSPSIPPPKVKIEDQSRQWRHLASPRGSVTSAATDDDPAYETLKAEQDDSGTYVSPYPASPYPDLRFPIYGTPATGLFVRFDDIKQNPERFNAYRDAGLRNSPASGMEYNSPAPTHTPTVRQPAEPRRAHENPRLQKTLAEASPLVLEAKVQHSIQTLNKLKGSMLKVVAQDTTVQQWIERIEDLEKQPLAQPTIIGVVGNTGAGKSSVINAMLDEERLVPTNCMRACTAVVTSLSWNDSDDEAAKYRAEIEFIKPEDWEKELRVLFAEILDGSGNISREIYAAESEAGVAFAKIRAVYPDMTKEDIAKSTVVELMQQPVIRSVLGTTRKVEEVQPDRFYRRLQHYVDSKEKSTKEPHKKESRELEFWPLIKIVRIFTKSDALSTGAVIVDLPGVHDSNAARAQVAQNFMKQCTGLWIVAPITRAVDDKAAKSLLGESFKRQLKYDGTYSRVTFICSKTDDISITEASDSLGLTEEMSSNWDKMDETDKEESRLKKQLEELKESKSIYGEVVGNADDDLEVWDKLQDDLDNGKTVYAPMAESKKRKRSEPLHTSRKKRAVTNESESDPDLSRASEDEDDGEDSQSDRGEVLTVDAINAKIAELKATKKEARLQRREIDAKIHDVKDQMKGLKSAKDVIQAEMSAVCIAGRNKYSKGAIQQDFAAGIKELDQENAVEEDEENFNPEEDLRDYEEVARSLPVFCVSSRAYQKLSGRLQRDQGVPGFSSAEETEVPQLQAHCKMLTEAGRASNCRRFLNLFHQLLNSLSLWSSSDGSEINLSDAEKAAEGKYLQSRLVQLGKDLESAVENCLSEMKDSLSENLYEKFDEVVQAAVDEANITSAKWGAPINRANRAIVRRNGVYANAQGLHDFNSQLTEPIMKQLASNWEKAFTRRLPTVLANYRKQSKALLEAFHQTIETRAMQHGTGAAGIMMLGQQLHNYERIFQDLTIQMIELINSLQREASREFTPIIAQRLASAYAWCTAESGPGQYARMKQYLNNHIDSAKQTMFHDSTLEVKRRLTQMCRSVEEAMSNKADEVFLMMRRDYVMAITGSNLPLGQQLPKWQRAVMAEVSQIIDEMESDQAAKPEDERRAGDDSDRTIVQEPVVKRSASPNPFAEQDISLGGPTAASTTSYASAIAASPASA